MPPRRAALYLRVSTEEQTAENQRPELERLAERRGIQIAATYSEVASGAARERPELERLMADAQRRQFDVVLVWALDRLGRRMGDTVARVLELERIGVDVLSAREPWLDTTGPVRSLLVSVFAWVAQQERERLLERTMAGIARARAAGTPIGRPRRITGELLERVRELAAAGESIRKIAQRVHVPRSTVAAALSSNPPPKRPTGKPAKRRAA